MVINEENDRKVLSLLPTEEGAQVRLRPSKVEEVGILKDRDRPRAAVGQTRQSLGAVGRVASRVRTSGISKISTFLPRGKDDEDTNASPWGVGTAALLARSQSTPALPETSRLGSVDCTQDAEMKSNAGMLDVSSPLSTDEVDQGKAPSPVENKSQATMPISLFDRQASHVRCKFSFRPSASIDSRSPRDVVGGMRSPKEVSGDSRAASPKGSGKHIVDTNEKDVVTSVPVAEGEKKDGWRKSPSKVMFVSETIDIPEAAILDPAQDMERSRMLMFGFGRGKNRAGESKRRSKNNLEKQHGILGLARARSLATKDAGAADEVAARNSQARGLSGGKSTVLNSKSSPKTCEQSSSHVKVKKAGWFGFFSGDGGGARGKGGASDSKKKSKSQKTLLDGKLMGQDFFARASTKRQDSVSNSPRIDLDAGLGSRAGAKHPTSPGYISVMNAEEFAVEESDEEGANETPIRSLAVDDFISYQTKKGKKGK